MDYDEDNRGVRKTTYLSKDEDKYMTDNNLSPTKLMREAIKNHKKNKKKDTFEKKYEIFQKRVVIIFIGLICFFLSQLKTIPLILILLFMLLGCSFIFIGLFDMILRIIPMINWRKKT